MRWRWSLHQFRSNHFGNWNQSTWHAETGKYWRNILFFWFSKRCYKLICIQICFLVQELNSWITCEFSALVKAYSLTMLLFENIQLTDQIFSWFFVACAVRLLWTLNQNSYILYLLSKPVFIALCCIYTIFKDKNSL